MSGFWGTAKEDAWHRRKAAEYAREEAIRQQGARSLADEKRSFEEQLAAKDREMERMRAVVEACQGGAGSSATANQTTTPLMLALFDTLHGGVSFRPAIFAQWLCRACPEEPAMAEELMVSWLETSQCSEESMQFFFERYSHAADPVAYVDRVLAALPKMDSPEGRGTKAFVAWAVQEGKLDQAFQAALALPKSRKRDSYGTSVIADAAWETMCVRLALSCMPLLGEQSIQRLGSLQQVCPLLSKALTGVGGEEALLRLLHFAESKNMVDKLLRLRVASQDNYVRRTEGQLPDVAACKLAAEAASDAQDASMMAVIVDRLLTSLHPVASHYEGNASHYGSSPQPLAFPIGEHGHATGRLREQAFEATAVTTFEKANGDCMRGKLEEYRTTAIECLGAFPLANIEAEVHKRLQSFVNSALFNYDFTAQCTTQHTKPESLAKCKKCSGASHSLWGWCGAALAAKELGYLVKPAHKLATVRKWLEGRKCGHLFIENERVLRQLFQE